MTKTIFWNVDTQYDFMKPDGKLSVPGATAIEGNLEYLTKIAAVRQITVVNTADYHTPKSKELSDNPDFKITFPPHCMAGTEGAEFIEATKPAKPYIIDWRDASFDPAKVKEHLDIVIYKDNFDVFNVTGAPHTEKVLHELNPRRAIVYGVATNVCVDFAVKGLLQRGLQVYVPTDAIKELPGLPLEKVLESWKNEGVQLIRTDEVLKYI
ncbi:cysteine hydrolase [Candidatus Woesearchaeota archaeon]|nr:cysteine hydrolase [Candidatus Woesearchaeota archaeon]